MTSTKRAFTLIELLVVVAMIAVILGALSHSFSSARARARIQKATSEVKVISQAILAYENWSAGNKLETMADADADAGNLKFLLGKEASQTSGQIPVMLMAQLKSGKIVDPWGTTYKVTIKRSGIGAAQTVSLWTGFFLPNYFRLGVGERQ